LAMIVLSRSKNAAVRGPLASLTRPRIGGGRGV
jgi:hypothetical protein